MSSDNLFKKNFIKVGNLEHVLYGISRANSSSFAIVHINNNFNVFKESITAAHANDFYTLVWIVSGNGTHTVDFEDIEVEDGTLFFISPKHIHEFKCLHIEESITFGFTEEFLLNFKREEADRLRQTLFFGEKGAVYCQINNVLKEQLLDLVCLLEDEYANGEQQKSHDFYMANLFAIFLYELERKALWFRTTPGDLRDFSYDIYIQYRKEIENNYKTMHKVVDYTTKMNISVAKLTACIKKYSSATPLQMILDRIILEAKRMLRYSSFTIKEIYTDLGFEDSSNFSKFFKHNVGIAPQQFRAENKK